MTTSLTLYIVGKLQNQQHITEMRIIRCCHKYYVNMGMKSELAAPYMCAGDLWDVDKEEWEYEPVLIKDAETNTVHVKFQQVLPRTSQGGNFRSSCTNEWVQSRRQGTRQRRGKRI